MFSMVTFIRNPASVALAAKRSTAADLRSVVLWVSYALDFQY